MIMMILVMSIFKQTYLSVIPTCACVYVRTRVYMHVGVLVVQL